ncbi:hypothetical protein SHKM778_60320 [Streptomyces sp. KM77-8]|uniref:Uncharacterized protein n=1 Tax=Streptomyces haneummycinicus TaxID=3074435 RepID=A0AAT9HQK3_9ACTN
MASRTRGTGAAQPPRPRHGTSAGRSAGRLPRPRRCRPYRAQALYFYRLSAVTGLLTALHRVACDKPALMREHLAVFIRHATSTDLPHAQIRELARRTALVLAAADDSSRDHLKAANRPDRCSIDRTLKNEHGGGLSDAGDRYRFDALDTVPYWFRPLARVFSLPVDTIACKAETWILDKWGLSEKDWWTDARELRSERVSARMGHRHGSIPPEESLRLYLEYHSMLAAAGELVDEHRPLLIEKWTENENPGTSGWPGTCCPTDHGWPTSATPRPHSPICSSVPARTTAPGPHPSWRTARRSSAWCTTSCPRPCWSRPP